MKTDMKRNMHDLFTSKETNKNMIISQKEIMQLDSY